VKAITLAAIFCCSVASANPNTQCNIAACNAGAKVVSYYSKSEPYFMCPTQELAEYTSFVLGMMAASYEMTGSLPNISPITGEPEAKGDMKIMMDRMRSHASIKTYDQATALCSPGKGGLKLMVSNNPSNSMVMWVFEEKTKASFWVNKAHMDLRTK
jgi:hypothetical protein